MPATQPTLDRARLAALMEAERRDFVARHPRSRTLAGRATGSLLGGVPMNWMIKWPGPFPIFAEEASGAHLTDVDGHEYVDFCLGDTGAMAGHAPPATVAAVATQAARDVAQVLVVGLGEHVTAVGNDLELDPGVGVCGKGGQNVPVGVGIPTLKVDRLTVGGTAKKDPGGFMQ